MDINSAEDMANLPDYTAVASATVSFRGKPACIVIQKRFSEWWEPGGSAPIDPKDFSPVFFPAKVVYQV